MDTMLAYEECIVDAVPRNMEVFHPNWPTMWPRLLTDGHLRPDLMDDETKEKGPMMSQAYRWNKPLSESVKEKLWECEEERFLFKACLRRLLELRQDERTRMPFYQPEENWHKQMGKRLYTDPRNRYPFDLTHDVDRDSTWVTRDQWSKLVEEEGDV